MNFFCGFIQCPPTVTRSWPGPRRRSAEIGVPMSQRQIDNLAACFQHWIKAVSADPMAIKSAVKDADLMAEYMLGLERQMTTIESHKK